MTKRNRKQKPSKGHPSSRQRTKPAPAEARPIQFDWKKEWSKRVKPHLQHPLVQFALNWGMRMCAEDWKPGDPPYIHGDITLDSRRDPRKGTLRWYQPIGHCHYIAFFSMVIGVINYPELNWRFATGKFHTVPVGYDENGQPRVVMDILLFDDLSAEQSIEFTLRARDAGPACGWKLAFHVFETDVASAIREALNDKDEHPSEHYVKSLLKRIHERVGQEGQDDADCK